MFPTPDYLLSDPTIGSPEATTKREQPLQSANQRCGTPLNPQMRSVFHAIAPQSADRCTGPRRRTDEPHKGQKNSEQDDQSISPNPMTRGPKLTPNNEPLTATSTASGNMK
jgi:hypothetical protein